MGVRWPLLACDVMAQCRVKKKKEDWADVARSDGSARNFTDLLNEARPVRSPSRESGGSRSCWWIRLRAAWVTDGFAAAGRAEAELDGLQKPGAPWPEVPALLDDALSLLPRQGGI